jgi:hypothetical protein
MPHPAKVIAQLNKVCRLLEEAVRSAPYTGNLAWHQLNESLEGYRAELWYEEALRREAAHQPQ